jgi:NADH-quinone oxidoreductase subunit E
MPVIAVHEVTTFYNMFNQKPVGRFKLNVCTNLPCQLRGGQHALEHLEQRWVRGPDRRRRVFTCRRRVSWRLRRRAGDARQRPQMCSFMSRRRLDELIEPSQAAKGRVMLDLLPSRPRGRRPASTAAIRAADLAGLDGTTGA